MKKKYYITTPIYYANGSPHIGHFLTTTVADVLARYHRIDLGDSNVFFTTGLDEHGTTVEQSAIKEGFKLKTFQDYVDKRAKEWKKTFDDTSISYDYFVRTTDKKHKKHAQDFIKRLVEAGDVYKSTYKGKYCNGCEKFLTLSDQDERGLCPIHRPNQVIETEEKNHFFRLSKYAQKVKKLIKEKKLKIIPESKRKEILSRLSERVEDISISRPLEKVAWGIGFPGDDKQTIYVWVEALMNYTSSLEINNKKEFRNDAHLTLGKDINWFHSVIWPAFLLSAGKPLFKESFVHSFFLIGGSKISKSLGNIITPEELVKLYGIDGARYLILSNFPYKSDSDVTWKYLNQKYTADLANGLGNLVARVAGLCGNAKLPMLNAKLKISSKTSKHIENYRLDLALEEIWKEIAKADKLINEKEVWNLKGKEKQEVLRGLVETIRQIAYDLKHFLPNTAEKIEKQFKGPVIKSGKPLFPRLK